MEMFFLLVIQPIIRLAALTRLEVSTIFQAHALIHASFVAETAVARVIAECTGTTGVIRTETGRNMFFGHIGHQLFGNLCLLGQLHEKLIICAIFRPSLKAKNPEVVKRKRCIDCTACCFEFIVGNVLFIVLEALLYVTFSTL